jgi:hypothetical protein
MSVDTFSIDKPFLHDLLKEVSTGRAQLPEFQRGWVWPDKNIASLLASISLGYPAGTLMMLRTGGDVRFKLRPVEGSTPPAGTQPERLILDGQQRLTSLFQAVASGRPVETQDVRKHKISGWFYMDMRKALNHNADREDAVLFLPTDRVQRNFRGEITADCSTPEKEYEACFFPLAKVFGTDDWNMGFQEYWNYDRDKIKFWSSFNQEVIGQFNRYQLPVIELNRDTPRQAVCQVFEKVNTGGVTLTVFELLTATFAADEFDLRQHWEKECRAAWSGPEYRILREVANTDFLQAISPRHLCPPGAGGRDWRGRRAPPPHRVQARRHAPTDSRRIPAVRSRGRERDAQGREVPAPTASIRHQVPALRQPAHPARRDPCDHGAGVRGRRGSGEARALVLVRCLR